MTATLGEDAFRELADFAPVVIWRSGVDKSCGFFDAPWLAFTGRTLEEELGSVLALARRNTRPRRPMSAIAAERAGAVRPLTTRLRQRRLHERVARQHESNVAMYWDESILVAAPAQACIRPRSDS